MKRYASHCIMVAALSLGLVLALTISGHSEIAFFVGLLGAAAALSAVRELIASRENRP